VVIAQPRTEHRGDRPTWTCPACAQPWPCAPAKAQLIAEFRRRPSSLTIYMSACMGEALNDLATPGEAPPDDLYERFVAWIRPSLAG